VIGLSFSFTHDHWINWIAYGLNVGWSLLLVAWSVMLYQWERALSAVEVAHNQLPQDHAVQMLDDSLVDWEVRRWA
jgi:hypothetical protein